MQYQATTNLTLAQGETRKMLVEAKTTVFVATGVITLRSPLGWLAETVVAQEIVLEAEETLVVESGGWIDFTALDSARLVLIPLEGVALWRQLGRCLDAFFGTDKAKFKKA